MRSFVPSCVTSCIYPAVYITTSTQHKILRGDLGYSGVLVKTTIGILYAGMKRRATLCQSVNRNKSIHSRW